MGRCRQMAVAIQTLPRKPLGLEMLLPAPLYYVPFRLPQAEANCDNEALNKRIFVVLAGVQV